MGIVHTMVNIIYLYNNFKIYIAEKVLLL